MKKEELLQKLTASEEVMNVAYIPLHQVIEWVKELEETPKMDEKAIDELAKSITSDLSDRGLDLVQDYDLTISGREVEIDGITYDEVEIEDAVRDSIESFLED